jgi:hypothetical protein
VNSKVHEPRNMYINILLVCKERFNSQSDLCHKLIIPLFYCSGRGGLLYVHENAFISCNWNVYSDINKPIWFTSDLNKLSSYFSLHHSLPLVNQNGLSCDLSTSDTAIEVRSTARNTDAYLRCFSSWSIVWVALGLAGPQPRRPTKRAVASEWILNPREQNA